MHKTFTPKGLNFLLPFPVKTALLLNSQRIDLNLYDPIILFKGSRYLSSFYYPIVFIAPSSRYFSSTSERLVELKGMKLTYDKLQYK
jgi:hypothetical protein